MYPAIGRGFVIKSGYLTKDRACNDAALIYQHNPWLPGKSLELKDSLHKCNRNTARHAEHDSVNATAPVLPLYEAFSNMQGTNPRCQCCHVFPRVWVWCQCHPSACTMQIGRD